MKGLFKNLNESKLNESRIKPFRRVNVGDTATDYNGDTWKVLAVGKVKDLMRYDDSGAAEELDPNEDAIALDGRGGTAVRLYDEDGAVVYESVNQSQLNERNTKLYVYPSSKKDHQMISNWLTRSNFHAEEDDNSFMFPVAGQRDADATEISLDKEFTKLGANVQFVLEGRRQIKRKYGEKSSIYVYEKSSIRNRVIDFIGRRFVTEEELLNFLNQISEEKKEDGKIFKAKSWLKANNRYFESFNNRGQKVTVLSKYGKRILDKIINPEKNKQIVTESIGLFKNSIFESTEINENIEMK